MELNLESLCGCEKKERRITILFIILLFLGCWKIFKREVALRPSKPQPITQLSAFKRFGSFDYNFVLVPASGFLAFCHQNVFPIVCRTCYAPYPPPYACAPAFTHSNGFFRNCPSPFIIVFSPAFNLQMVIARNERRG